MAMAFETDKVGSDSLQLELFEGFKTYLRNDRSFNFTFVDLFAGIGGFRIALEQLGGVCLGYSEIDKKAIAVYRHNFIKPGNPEDVELGDISHLTKLPFDTDLIVGGVPCQPWSIAGKLQGLDDPRGKLWLDAIRTIQLNQPKAFIFEKVKGLAEPRNRQSLNYILSRLREAGYIVHWQVLNSYDFGLPQDRDRIFIVGIRQDIEKGWGFSFPQSLTAKPKLYDVIPGLERGDRAKRKFSSDVLFEGKIPASRGRFQKRDELNDFFLFSDIRDGHTTIHSWDLIESTDREKQICQTLLKNRRKKIYGEKDGNPLSFQNLSQFIPDLTISELETLVSKKILRVVAGIGYEFVNSKISSGINCISKIFLPHADAIATLTTTGTRDFVATLSIPCQEPEAYKQAFIREIYRPQKFKPLSAKDYARLQGFPEGFQLADNETTAKHQFGNAVSVPVVYHLCRALLPMVL